MEIMVLVDFKLFLHYRKNLNEKKNQLTQPIQNINTYAKTAPLAALFQKENRSQTSLKNAACVSVDSPRGHDAASVFSLSKLCSTDTMITIITLCGHQRAWR